VETIKLPNCDLQVSRVGFGGCPLGGHGWGDVDDRRAIAAVRRALDCGVNFFDTADVYGMGRSEELLSEALGNQRRNVVIATKFGVRREHGRTFRDTSPKWLQTALCASLRRLRVDCIDLYYIHWPDAKVPLDDTLEMLQRLRESGQLRAIGLSNFTTSEVLEAIRCVPISCVQAQFSLIDQHIARPLLDGLAEQRLPLITWGSLAQGLLSGKYDQSISFTTGDRRLRYPNFQPPKLASNLLVVDKLRRESAELGCTPAQLAVRWLLQTSGVGAVLCGAKRPEQAEENAAAGSLPPLPFDVAQRLESAAQSAVLCECATAA
jgi:aryl-alcohol dehydrogenase-like predicted oxidoreductase